MQIDLSCSRLMRQLRSSRAKQETLMERLARMEMKYALLAEKAGAAP